MKNFKKIGLGLLLTLFITLTGVLSHKALAAGISPSAWPNAKYTLTDINTVTANVGGQSFNFTYDQFSTLCGTGNIRCYTAPTSLQDTFCNSDSFISIKTGNFDLTKKNISGTIYANYTAQPASIPPCKQFGTPNQPKAIQISVSSAAAAQADQVSISAPKDGATVKGKVTVSVKALSSVGITGVQTTVNDASKTTITGATSISYAPGHNPKSWSGSGTWDTSSLPDGQYTITSTLIESDGSNKTDSVTVTTNNGNPAAGTTDNNASCESNLGGGLAWLICPALGLADSAAGAFNSFVEGQLCFNTGSSSSTGGVVCGGNNNLDQNVHNAWSVFKNIASAMLVIVMLVMVFSQAMGSGPVDAYTVRKMLPKLVAAVIIMQLSWILLRFAIDLSNDFGKGIAGLMQAPFGGADNLTLKHLVGVDLSGNSAVANNVSFFVALAAGTVAGVVALSVPGLVLLALYVVLALLTAFIVLLLRKLLIIMLVILAPLALILWILPGTERYWKMWSDNFIKLIAMFPIIMAIIAAGRIFASITAGDSSVMFDIHLAVLHIGPLSVPYVASISNFADLAIIIGAFFGPYFFLPQTFKWGGAAMGAVGKGVPQAMERMGGKQAKEYLGWRRDISPSKLAREARKAQVAKRARLGFYGDLGSSGPMGYVRRARLGGAEALIPGLRGRDRELRQSIVDAGRTQEEVEAVKEARLGLEQEETQAHVTGLPGGHDEFVQDIARNGAGVETHGKVRTEAEVMAAMEMMAQYGGPNDPVLEELHHRAIANGGEEREQWNKFIGRNSGTLLSKFPQFYKDRDYSQTIHTPTGDRLGDLNTTIDDVTPESFTTSGVGAESVKTTIGHLSQTINTGRGAAPGSAAAEAAARAHQQLVTMYVAFGQSVASPSTRPRINRETARAMITAIGGGGTTQAAVRQSINELNRNRGANPGVPIVDVGTVNASVLASARTDSDMNQAIRTVLENVRPDGNLR